MKLLLKRRMLLFISLIISIVFTTILYFSSMFPLKYLIVFLIILTLLFIGLYKGENEKNHQNKLKIAIFKIMHLVLSIILMAASVYVGKATNFIGTITGGKDTIITVDVVVRENSNYSSLADLKDQPFGWNTKADAINLNKAKTSIKEKLELEDDLLMQQFDSDGVALYHLTSNTVEAVLIKDIDYQAFLKENNNYKETTKILEKIEIKIAAVKANSANVTSEPFCVYISGCDKTGDITRGDQLSDVNMMAIINPNTNQILMISVPRDYYVDLYKDGTNMGKDKLTHSAKWGIDCSQETMSQLLGVNTNYYAKFNFTSFMNVIDALGGTIQIKIPKNDDYQTKNGDWTFTTKKGHYDFECGKTYDMTSKQALCFVRERKSFIKGDDIRGKNQMLMLKAIVKECCSPKILTKMDRIFESLQDSFDTNMSEKEVKALVNKQLDDMQGWDIQQVRLKGDPTKRTTVLASVAPQDVIRANPNGLYVNDPYIESIEEAKGYISQVMSNQLVTIDK